MRAGWWLVLATVACGDEDDTGGGGGDADSADTGPPTLEGDIQPLFDSTCALSGCHKDGSPGGDMLLVPELAYSELVGVASTQVPGMMRVRPSSPDESYLLRKVEGSHAAVGGSGDAMPPTAGLDADGVALVRAWIEAGAPR